ncbi:uncharacterized protein LOC143900004 isoform X2 [Temnothorax americanus]|uniref:uncharacterized protein LOC143900004 isoform X2 n=1 Tax=Temnothorax americanus TaxID=1964332 RepID=UPI004068F285
MRIMRESENTQDSKKALEERIANRRPRIPLFEKCQSASESELESSINNKHLGGPANAINKRNMTGSTKETVSKKITSAVSKTCTSLETKKSKSVKITDHTKRDSQDNVKKSSNGENSIESLKKITDS